MPAPTVPADDIAILCRTGSRALVRYLIQNPDSYYGDAKDALNLPVSSLTRDLGLLERIGVVLTDSRQPLGSRRGRSPRYRIDVKRVEELLADLRTQLLG